MSRVVWVSSRVRILTATFAVLVAVLTAVSPGLSASATTLPWQDVVLPGQMSNNAPAFEDFNGRLYIAVTGIDNDFYNYNEAIYISSVNAAGQDLRPWTLRPGLTSPSGMAIKVFNNRLYLAARGPDDKVYLTSSSNGSTWTAWSIVPGGVATAGPALKVFKSRLYLAVRAASGSIVLSSTSNGTSWDSWRSVPNSATRTHPTLTVFNSKLLLGLTGLDGLIYLTDSIDGKSWSARKQVPGWGPNCDDPPTGPMRTNNGPGLAVLNSRLYVSARTGGCDVEDYPLLNSYDGKTWNSWERVSYLTIYDTPSLTTFNDRLYMATAGGYTDESLHLFFQ